MTGEGEGNEGTACPQTPRFEKLRSPTNAASDWRGAVPLLPSPSPFNLFFASPLTFAQSTRLETLATQATIIPFEVVRSFFCYYYYYYYYYFTLVNEMSNKTWIRGKHSVLLIY